MQVKINVIFIKKLKPCHSSPTWTPKTGTSWSQLFVDIIFAYTLLHSRTQFRLNHLWRSAIIVLYVDRDIYIPFANPSLQSIKILLGWPAPRESKNPNKKDHTHKDLVNWFFQPMFSQRGLTKPNHESDILIAQFHNNHCFYKTPFLQTRDSHPITAPLQQNSIAYGKLWHRSC